MAKTYPKLILMVNGHTRIQVYFGHLQIYTRFIDQPAFLVLLEEN